MASIIVVEVTEPTDDRVDSTLDCLKARVGKAGYILDFLAPNKYEVYLAKAGLEHAEGKAAVGALLAECEPDWSEFIHVHDTPQS